MLLLPDVSEFVQVNITDSSIWLHFLATNQRFIINAGSVVINLNP